MEICTVLGKAIANGFSTMKFGDSRKIDETLIAAVLKNNHLKVVSDIVKKSS